MPILTARILIISIKYNDIKKTFNSEKEHIYNLGGQKESIREDNHKGKNAEIVFFN